MVVGHRQPLLVHLLAQKVAAHLKAALPCDGFNILQNNGEAAGQTVKHLHFHIVPRSGTEPIVFESRPVDMQELAALAAAWAATSVDITVFRKPFGVFLLWAGANMLLQKKK